jgi:hypothetical protein
VYLFGDIRQFRYAIAFVDEMRFTRTTETPNSKRSRLAGLVRQLELQGAPGYQGAIGNLGRLNHPALPECFLGWCKRQGYAPSMPQQASSLRQAIDLVSRQGTLALARPSMLRMRHYRPPSFSSATSCIILGSKPIQLVAVIRRPIDSKLRNSRCNHRLRTVFNSRTRKLSIWADITLFGMDRHLDERGDVTRPLAVRLCRQIVPSTSAMLLV